MIDDKKQRNKNNILAMKFVVLVLFIFIVVTALSSVLNVMSYQNLTTEIYTNTNNLSVAGVRNNIEYAVSFGKPIEKFYGINDLLEEALNTSPDILGVGIVDSNNKLLYSVGENFSSIPSDLLSKNYSENSGGIYTSFKINENCSMALLLDKSFVSTSVNSYIKSIIKIDLLVMLAVIILALLIFFVLFYIKKQVYFNWLKIAGIVLLITAQLVLGFFVVKIFTDEYTNSVSKISYGVSQTVKNDLEKIIKKGIKMEDIVGLDEYFDSLVQSVPEIDKISISNHKIGDSFTTKIISDNNVYYVNVDSHVNEATIKNKVMEVIIDAAILIAITILLSLEISLFLGSSINKTKRKNSKSIMSTSGIRLFLFITHIALSLDVSFISTVSYNLFKKLDFPSASNVLVGLPFTVSLLSTVIGIIIWGKLIPKIGLKTSIILGIIFNSIGLIFSSFSDSLIFFSVSRAICGFGLASILTSTRMCVSLQDNVEKRTKFSSAISIGMLVGASCGVTIGGLLVDRTSYSFVFFTAAIALLLSLFLFSITNIKNSIKIKRFSFNKAIKILKLPNYFLYIIFILLPIFISSMFLSYSIPLYGNEINVSQTIISAMIMMNYIITAYLTNSVSNFSMRKFNNKKLTLGYEIMIIVAIMLFCLLNNLYAAIISVIILAVADSFGLVVASEALYDKEIAGIDKTTISLIFIFVSKVGSGIAPTLISLNLSEGVASASKVLPYVMIGGLLFFVVLNKTLKKQQS